jgi:hypothetical protein
MGQLLHCGNARVVLAPRGRQAPRHGNDAKALRRRSGRTAVASLVRGVFGGGSGLAGCLGEFLQALLLLLLLVLLLLGQLALAFLE